MLKTLRFLMIAIMLLLAAAVAALFWARSNGLLPGRDNQFDANQGPLRFGEPFSLVSHTGDPITDAAMKGKPVAVFFGFTSCPEVCPTTLYDVDRWMDLADPSGTELEGFFVTIDPERDDPEILNSYVTYFSDRITGITGEPDKVWALADSWAVAYEKRYYSDDPADGYDINHTASVFLVDAKGNFRGTISYGASDDIAVGKLRNLL